jgi:hypothetical protein
LTVYPLGYWEVGVDSLTVASYSQPVSIPLTFYVKENWFRYVEEEEYAKLRQYGDEVPICVTIGARGVASLYRRDVTGHVDTFPLRFDFSYAPTRFLRLGKVDRRSLALVYGKYHYVFKTTVTVTPAELIDYDSLEAVRGAMGAESVEVADLEIVIEWRECDLGARFQGEPAATVKVKVGEGRNSVQPPRGGVQITVSPPPGEYRVSALPGGVFAVGVSASGGEPELSFAIGVGLSEEQARKSAVEVDLVDARTGARLRKVKARNLRLRFRLPPALPAPIYVYLEPRVGGAPVSARLWKFT